LLPNFSFSTAAQSDSEFIAFANRDLVDLDNPNLRHLLTDLLALCKTLLQLDGADITLRTKTGYRILYSCAQRLVLRQLRKWTRPDAANECVARVLVWITASIWPNGVLVECAPSMELNPEQSAELRRKAETALFGAIPSPIVIALGQDACRRAVRNLVDLLNRRDDLADVVLTMMETTTEALVGSSAVASAVVGTFYSAT
jgi:hypothetical protein